MAISQSLLPVSVSIVVPCFRSPGTLGKLCEEIEEHVRPLVDGLELVLVDDGSPDDTWSKIVELAYLNDWVRGIRLHRNYGQHNALIAGIKEASNEIIITLDDDLQHPPSEIGRLLSELDDETDLVYGTPRSEVQSGLRNLLSVTGKGVLSRVFGSEVDQKVSPFRAFRSDLLSDLQRSNDPYASIDIILSWVTTRVSTVAVDYAPRLAGSSGYSLPKLVLHFFNMLTASSARPLRFVSAIGAILSVSGFASLGYVLYRFFIGATEVQGFTFLASSILLFSGAQLLSIGLIGEYVARIHSRTTGRPSHSVRRRVGFTDSEPADRGFTD